MLSSSNPIIDLLSQLDPVQLQKVKRKMNREYQVRESLYELDLLELEIKQERMKQMVALSAAEALTRGRRDADLGRAYGSSNSRRMLLAQVLNDFREGKRLRLEPAQHHEATLSITTMSRTKTPNTSSVISRDATSKKRTITSQTPSISERDSNNKSMGKLEHLTFAMNTTEYTIAELLHLAIVHGSLAKSFCKKMCKTQKSREAFLAMVGRKRKSDVITLALNNAVKSISSEDHQSAPQDSVSSPAKRRRTTSTKPSKKKKEKRWTWTKKPGAPRRPLSAYNIFFSEERGRILKEIEASKNDQSITKNKSEAETTSSTVDSGPGQTALHMLADRRLDPIGIHKTGNVKHARSHGIIGFKDLAKRIGQKWRALPPEQLAEYKRLAAIDAKRYKDDVDKFNKEQERLMAANALKELGAIAA